MPAKLTDKEKAEKAETLNYSRDIYARRAGNHPQVKHVLDFFYEKIKVEYRVRSDHEKGYRHHIRVFILDLFVANQTDSDLYLTFSRNSNAYLVGKRYYKLWLTHRKSIKVVDYLENHGYIVQHKGFYRRDGKGKGEGKITRIRATEKFRSLLADEYKIEIGMYIWDWDSTQSTVILRDENKQEIPYEETEDTRHKKKNMEIINRNLEKHLILLHMTDDEYMGHVYQDEKGYQ